MMSRYALRKVHFLLEIGNRDNFFKSCTMEKKCSKCGKPKRLSHFRKIKKRDLVYESNICEDCIAERQKKRKESYREFADAMPV
jgi:hypothetical protein